MNDPLQIRIPTGHLRALLTETGALARLESFACEKIAEELIRKTPKFDVNNLERQAEVAIDQIITRKMRDLEKNWSMPPQVVIAIQAEVAKTLKDRVEKALEEATKRASAVVSHQINYALEEAETELRKIIIKQQAEFAAHMEERMRSIARTSFLDVLREAREGTP